MQKLLFPTLLFLFVCSAKAQKYGDPEFYLIDSLDIEAMDASEKEFLDSCLTIFHSQDHDTLRLAGLFKFMSSSSEYTVWPRYSIWFIDYLENQLNTGYDDPYSEKRMKRYQASNYGNIGYYHRFYGKGADTALIYNEMALSIDEEIQDLDGTATRLVAIGNLYALNGDNERAKGLYLRSLEITEELGDSIDIAYSYDVMAVFLGQQGDVLNALNYLEKSLKIYEVYDEKLSLANTLQNLGYLYNVQDDTVKAMENYQRCLSIFQEIDDKKGIGGALIQIGELHMNQDSLKLAQDYFLRSQKLYEEIGNKNSIAHALNYLGIVTARLEDYPKALEYFEESLRIREEIGHKPGVVAVLGHIGTLYNNMGDLKTAEDYLLRSKELSLELGYPQWTITSTKSLTTLYKKMGRLDLAFENYELYITMRDSINNIETQKATIKQQTKYEYEKRELAIQAEQEKKDAVAAQELRRQKLVRNGFMGGFAVVFLFAGVFFTQRNRIGKEKERSEELLLNILPEETAQELKQKGHSDAQLIDHVTVLFTDFKGFTALSEQVTPKELVADLHECFSAFDHICGKYRIEKIKTIGDAYMAAGGLPTPNKTHPQDVVKAALEMALIVEKGKAKKSSEGNPFFEIRIGIHTGPVVAGIVGVKKFQYDIWGDTVNTASRMESSGEVGKVNISESTYELLKEDSQFSFENRGKIEAKGKGEMEMYFVTYA